MDLHYFKYAHFARGIEFLSQLNNDRKTEKIYCDVIVETDGIQFQVHRCVVGIFSAYFKTMFKSNFTEKHTDVIHLFGPIGEEISHRTLSVIFDYMYTSEVLLSDETVFDVTIASEYLLIPDLTSICTNLLRKLLTLENWLRIFQLGLKINDSSLVEFCLHHEMFPVIFQNIKLHQLGFEEFYAIVNHCKSYFDSSSLLNTIALWHTKSNEYVSKQRFDKMMNLINFESLSPVDLKEKVLDNKLTNNLDETLLLRIKRIRQGKLSQKGLIIVGGCHFENSLKKYCPDSKEFLFRNGKKLQ